MVSLQDTMTLAGENSMLEVTMVANPENSLETTGKRYFSKRVYSIWQETLGAGASDRGIHLSLLRI